MLASSRTERDCTRKQTFYSPRVSVILTVRWGEVPHAFVVLKAGATATEIELRNYARDHLAHFKCPQKIHFVPELPKTATGKVQKYVLRGKQPAISKQ